VASAERAVPVHRRRLPRAAHADRLRGSLDVPRGGVHPGGRDLACPVEVRHLPPLAELSFLARGQSARSPRPSHIDLVN
jgi:hypothetical protein